jgi:hypothetical protein
MEWLFSAHKAHTSSLSQPNTRTELESHKSHKEKVEERFYRFGSSKRQGKHTSNPKVSSPNKWSSWGTYTPLKKN